MEGRMRYPVLEVDLEAVRQNAEVMCRLLGEQGIDVAGVIKFSDGDLEIARAYSEGAASRSPRPEQFIWSASRRRCLRYRRC